MNCLVQVWPNSSLSFSFSGGGMCGCVCVCVHGCVSEKVGEAFLYQCGGCFSVTIYSEMQAVIDELCNA